MLRSSAALVRTAVSTPAALLGRTESTTISQIPPLRSQFRPRSLATVIAPPTPTAPSRSSRKYILLSLVAIGSIGGYYIYSTTTNRAQSILSSNHFAPLKVISITPLTPTTSTIKLALSAQLLPPLDPTTNESNPIKSIYVLQPDLAIQRPYTPLSAASFDPINGNGELDLVVKRYPDGEVSRWLHRLRVGDQVSVRGPVVTWDFKEKYDEIVFIVGGTGVTPAYQLISHLLAPPTTPSSTTHPAPKLTLIYASPTPTEILIKPELDALSTLSPSALSIKYLVSNPSSAPGGWLDFAGSKGRKVELKELEKEGVVVGRIGKENLRGWIGRGDSKEVDGKRRVVIVCGPEGMVEAIAGPRPRSRAQAEAAHGGILRELGYSKEQVVKL